MLCVWVGQHVSKHCTNTMQGVEGCVGVSIDAAQGVKV